MRRTAASRLACGERPERICTKPALKRVPSRPLIPPFLLNICGCVVLAEQGIKTAAPIESVEVVEATHMYRPDENLRHGHASFCARHHLASFLRVAAHIDLGELDTLARQEGLSRDAIGTITCCVNLNGAHGQSKRRRGFIWGGGRSS